MNNGQEVIYSYLSNKLVSQFLLDSKNNPVVQSIHFRLDRKEYNLLHTYKQ